MSASTIQPTPTVPTDILELRAAEQRKRIHDSVLELRQQVSQKLNFRRKAQEYVLPAAGVATLVGLAFGYSATGVFTGRSRRAA